MTFLKKFLKHWYVLIGFLVFLYIIFYQIDISKTIKILSSANLYLIFLAILINLATTFILAKRWNYLKSVQNIKYKFKDSFLLYNIGFFFSTVTPGHLGDLIKVVYLKKDGYSVGKSLVSIILDRFADISFLLLIGYIGMCFFAKFFLKYIIILTILISLIILLLFLFNKKEFPKIVVKRILKFIIPDRYQESWRLNYQDFINDIKTYRFKNYLILYSVTLAIWIINYTSVFLLAKSVGITNIPFLYLAMSITIATLATLIPISILGLGTRDAILLFLFSLFNIGPEKTISFSALYLLLLLVAALVGFICWLKKPLKFKV